MKLYAFSTSKHGEGKSLPKFFFAVHISTLRRFNQICHIHFNPGEMKWHFPFCLYQFQFHNISVVHVRGTRSILEKIHHTLPLNSVSDPISHNIQMASFLFFMKYVKTIGIVNILRVAVSFN